MLHNYSADVGVVSNRSLEANELKMPELEAMY